jgi:hypothetical protein
MNCLGASTSLPNDVEPYIDSGVEVDLQVPTLRSERLTRLLKEDRADHMSTRRMRPTIRPLCQRHFTHMVSGMATLRSQLGDKWQIDLFSCTEPGCTSRYNLLHGYFDLASEVGASIEKDLTTLTKCRNDGCFMYLAYYDPETTVRTWRCSVDGCDGVRIE